MDVAARKELIAEMSLQLALHMQRTGIRPHWAFDLLMTEVNGHSNERYRVACGYRYEIVYAAFELLAPIEHPVVAKTVDRTLGYITEGRTKRQAYWRAAQETGAHELDRERAFPFRIEEVVEKFVASCV